MRNKIFYGLVLLIVWYYVVQYNVIVYQNDQKLQWARIDIDRALMLYKVCPKHGGEYNYNTKVIKCE